MYTSHVLFHYGCHGVLNIVSYVKQQDLVVYQFCL